MSPSPRPAPLKIHKDSHQIKKPSTTTAAAIIGNTNDNSNNNNQPRHPVIIYTQSPKVIHTRACDFMALVQKLTGLSHSPDDDDTSVKKKPRLTSVLPLQTSSSEETVADVVDKIVDMGATANVPPALGFPDMPLFCSPKSFCMGGPISPKSFCMGGPISPSFMEGMWSEF